MFCFTSSDTASKSLQRKLLSTFELAARQTSAVTETVARSIAGALAQREAETAVDLFL